MPLFTKMDYGLPRQIEFERDYKPSFSESMDAAWTASWNLNPLQAARNIYKINAALNLPPTDPLLPQTDQDALMEQWQKEYQASFMPQEAQAQRIREAGLEGMLKPQEAMTQEALEIIIASKREENVNALISEKSPGWRTPFAFMAGLAAGFADPINIGASLVPVPGLGYARLASQLGAATRNAIAKNASERLARSGVYAMHGAASGLFGSLLLEPLVYAGASAVQADYTMYNSLLNLAGGAVLGASIHAGISGPLGERFRSRNAEPQIWEYVPSSEESRELTKAHAEKIHKAYQDHIARLTDEERAKSDIAQLSDGDLKNRAIAAAIGYDSGLRNLSWQTQLPLREVYDRIRIDYFTGEYTLNGANGSLHQFGGARGMAAADAADGGRRMDNLSVAGEMEAAGKDARTIKIATGWEKGADGEWRYEIPDGKLRDGVRLVAKRSGDVIYYDATVGEILEAEDLFRAYPELKNMRVVFQELENPHTLGMYADNIIILNKRLAEKTSLSNAERMAEIEATPEYRAYAKALDDTDNIADPIEAEKEFDRIDAEWAKTDLGREYNELLNTNKRLTSAGTLDPETRTVLLHELQHAIQDIEGFARGANNSNPNYRRVAGEIEARNVQARMSMDAEERRGSLASETEDVPRDEQIVLHDDGTAAMAGEEKPRVAKVVEIDPSVLVDENGNPLNIFDTGALRKWLLEHYSGKIIKIKSDGTLQEFTEKGLRASVKRRGHQQRKAYGKLDELLENAIFNNTEGVDERHLGKVAGQKIYYAAA